MVGCGIFKGSQCHSNRTTHMKITKRQLRRLIREEKAKLNEMGPQSNNERTIGLYFPVDKLDQLSVLVDEIYENAWDAAADDLGPDEEIDEMIRSALRVVFLRQTNKRR